MPKSRQQKLSLVVENRINILIIKGRNDRVVSNV